MNIPEIIKQCKGMSATEAARHYQMHLTQSTSLEHNAVLVASFTKAYPGRLGLLKVGAEAQVVDLEIVARNNQISVEKLRTGIDIAVKAHGVGWKEAAKQVLGTPPTAPIVSEKPLPPPLPVKDSTKCAYTIPSNGNKASGQCGNKAYKELVVCYQHQAKHDEVVAELEAMNEPSVDIIEAE
jgi:hypothetical protein